MALMTLAASAILLWCTQVCAPLQLILYACNIIIQLRIGQESDVDDDEMGSVTSETMCNEPAEKCTPESSTIQDTLQLHDPSDNSTESLPMPVPTNNKLVQYAVCTYTN